MKYYLSNLLIKPTDTQTMIKAKVAAALRIPERSFRFSILSKASELRPGGCVIRANIAVETNEFVRDTSVVFFNERPKLEIPNIGPKVIGIIGAGIAGLLAAKVVLDAGGKPIVFDKGKDLPEREMARDVYEKNGIFDPKNNIRLGFGGHAIYTGGYLKLDHSPESIYFQEDLAARLNDKAILTEEIAYLPASKIKKYMMLLKEEILSKGGEFRFNSEVTKIKSLFNRLKGIDYSEGKNNRSIKLDALIYCGSDDYPAFLQKHLREKLPVSWAVGVVVENRQRKVETAYFGSNAKAYPPFIEAGSFPSKNGFDVHFVSPLNSCTIFPFGVEENSVSIMPGVVDRKINENACMPIVVLPKDGSKLVNNPLTEIARSSFKNSMPYACPSESLSDFLLRKEPYHYRVIKPTCPRGFYLGDLNSFLPGPVADALHYGIATLRKRYPFFLEDDSAISGFILRPVVDVPKDFGGLPSPMKGFYALTGDGLFPQEISASARKGVAIAASCVQDI